MKKIKDIEDKEYTDCPGQLGNFHIDTPTNMDYLLSQFDTLNKGDNSKIIRNWVERFGKTMFKNGQEEAFDRVVDLIGPNINKETREALEFLINEK